MNRLALVGAVVLAVHVTACSDVPVAPQSVPRFSATTDGKVTKLAKYEKSRRPIQTFAMQTIGPAGGTVSLGSFEIVVPAGALSQPTSLTIALPSDAKLAGYVVAEFGPHGIKFDLPVTIKLPFAGTTADSNLKMHVLWYDGSQWTPLPSSVTTDGRIQADTDHFSEYGTEEDPSRGITLAGG
jgi:hypothetical protein